MSFGNNPTPQAARRRKLLSTRRLGTAIVSSMGISGGLAVAAEPAYASATRHRYFYGCLQPGQNGYGQSIVTRFFGTGSWMKNWGYAGNRCSGNTTQGWGCIDEASGSHPNNIHLIRANYYCVQPGYTAFSSDKWCCSTAVFPIVRVEKQNNYYGHIATGSSANDF
jgi:hypothetical protein